MGSKKLKGKKLKCKSLKKLHKLKSRKPKKSILLESYRETDHDGNDVEKNIPNDRLCSKCSRYYFKDDNASGVKHFAKVREDYFRYLQNVVHTNCELYDSAVTQETLENLTLELEQNALLACLQVEVYQRTMLGIIESIKKSTEEKQLHKEVKDLLKDSVQKNICEADSPTSAANSPNNEAFNKIPTITFNRTDNNSEINNFWGEESICNMDPYYSYEGAYLKDQNGLQANSNIQCWGESNNQPHHELTENNFLTVQNADVNSPTLHNNSYVETTPQLSKEEHKPDPLSESRNQLQKLVEQTLKETEKVNRLKRDEQERASIAQILQGDDSLDERFNDSLSDNETESKENFDSNLIDRLEKMRELFGMEDKESQLEINSKKPKQNCKISQVHIRNKRPTIWRYEKFIQLHKYSVIAGEMTFERRQINQNLFIELFGEDSDEEHKEEFSSTEKYRSCCTERISSWVVKYLMPFYHEKRILGRNVFKSLGHYISEAIVDEIQYPDEWTVKYFVSKFFPPKKKYVCDADILSFQLD